MQITDLSQPIENGMPVYPGDTGVSIERVKRLDRDHYNNHLLSSGMHSGTHIDSPMHLTEYSKFILQAPLDAFIGKGCLLDVRGQNEIGMKPEYEDMVTEGSIVLLYTGWDSRYGRDEYYHNAPCVTMELCEFLISKKIKMLGIDTSSPDAYPFPVHKALFKKGIYVLENLTNLGTLVGVKDFEVIALPLKIMADSSIVRAVAVIRD